MDQQAMLEEAETFRLRALHELKQLDTDAEERFDRITALAQRAFQTETSAISLIDKDRQWFKSRQGLEAKETPRDISFCTHAIAQDGVFVVPDASLDDRFKDNPLVKGGPRIRFYAGAPLKLSSGHNIGTLCIFDPAPRAFGQDDETQLTLLARLVVEEMEVSILRRRLAREKSVREQVEQLIETKSLELYEARIQAEAASRAKTEFLHTIGHELRTPLNAIIGFAQILEMSPANQMSGRQKEYLRHIEDSGERLLDLVNQMLQMAKLELGDIRVEVETVDIAEAARFGAEKMKKRLAARGQHLSVRIAPSVRAVRVDRPAIAQIIRILLDNAIKFSPQQALIALSLDEEGGEIALRVMDNGPGIAPDKLALIGQPFFQADSGLNRRHEGAGLGLATATALAKAMGCRLQIESEPGHGTTALLVMPRADGDVVAPRKLAV